MCSYIIAIEHLKNCALKICALALKSSGTLMLFNAQLAIPDSSASLVVVLNKHFLSVVFYSSKH